VMDFGKDTAVHNIGDEYMLGPSLLVAPVTAWHDSTRRTYLPAGQGWYDLYSGNYTPGGHTVTADAPYERMPVYVKEGSILPLGPALQYTGERPADTITLFVYTGKDGRFSLYEDEGTNYDYEKGAYANIPLSYDEQSATLTIGRREGSFQHMLQKRTFRIVRVSKDSPVPLDPAQSKARIVHYKGSPVSVTLK
jgi:alpha-D-xyloside xylohydrolase